RANLTILTDATVTRILFEGSSAVGAECAINGSLQQFRADGEVLLCAGALQSPKILQLSGIGPADHLRSFNLPVICDSPGVGQSARSLGPASAIPASSSLRSKAATQTPQIVAQRSSISHLSNRHPLHHCLRTRCIYQGYAGRFPPGCPTLDRHPGHRGGG